MNSHKIRKEFKTIKDLKKNIDAFGILYDREPMVKMSGAFMTHGILAHLNDHEIIGFTARSFLIKELRSNEVFAVQKAFDEALEKPRFTME